MKKIIVKKPKKRENHLKNVKKNRKVKMAEKIAKKWKTVFFLNTRKKEEKETLNMQ